MSRREQDEEPCGCTIDLSTGTVHTCPECSRSLDVQPSDQTIKNVQRARRVIR